MQNLNGLQQLILFIEENNPQKLNKKTIEQISGYSFAEAEFVFKKIFNESILSFQKRLKSEHSSNPRTKIIGEPKLLFQQQKVVFFKGIEGNYDNDEIANLWDSMAIPVENTKEAYYGLIIDQPLINTQTKSRFDACVYAPNTSAGLESKTIFGQHYLKYTYKGNYDGLDDFYCLMYQDVLRQQNIQLDNSPFIEHYQMNDMNCEQKQDFITHIFVPIKKVVSPL